MWSWLSGSIKCELVISLELVMSSDEDMIDRSVRRSVKTFVMTSNFSVTFNNLNQSNVELCLTSHDVRLWNNFKILSWMHCMTCLIYCISFRFYLTNRLHFPVRVYCNRSQTTSQHVKNKKYDTRRNRVAWLLFFTRCDDFCDLLQYTDRGKCNLNVIFSNGLLKVYGGIKKEKQVRWRGFDVICLCVL